MKQTRFHRAIVAIAMMLIGWLPSLAHDFEVDGVFYKKTSDNTVAVTYKGEHYYDYSNEYSGDIVIPSSVNYNGITYSVTSIGAYAFTSCSSLTSIQIPNSVTSIRYCAFSGCSGLTSIQIPNSVTSIGEEAFGDCLRLTSVEIGNSVTSIGSRAFYYCKSLTSVEIPNSVTSIGDEAFAGCSSLTSIVIPNSVTSIEDGAFSRCLGLTSIEIPNSVTSIGIYAFRGCSGLTSIEIPNSVTSIGDYAFYECASLTSVVIGNSVTSIGDYAFQECTRLTDVVIGNSVTSIGNSAFYGCSSLTSIEIGNSVTSIEEWALGYCTSLTSIEIPNSVTSIGNSAFSGCTSLTSVVWNAKKCSDFSSSSIPFKNSSKITSFTFGDEVEHIPAYLCYNLSKLTGIEIPNSVTSIGDYAFYYCSNLTSIEIPNSVTSIGYATFAYCKSLTSIVIGNSVTSIGYAAFAYCSSLTSIVIGNSVTSIGEWAFGYCTSLTSIVIGNSVTSIGEWAFGYCTSLTSIEIPDSVTNIGVSAFYGCSSLTKVTCLAINPPMIDSNTFSKYSAELYVPAGCISAYQSANYWKNFNIQELPIILSTFIALNKTSASLKATETLTLVATVLPETATNKSVIWTSSNEAVATVDENGVVTAVALGEAVITATTTDGTNLSASCQVTVVPTLAETITLDKTGISLEATETATLVANVLPELTTNKSVTWTSSNEAVATVDANGVVTAVAVGEAVIKVTTTDGSNLSASCKVTVVPTMAETITLDKTEISIEATETATLVATVLPELTTNKSVTWTSSNEAVATVDANGVVTAIAVGEATITATTTDGSDLSASCKVTVVPTLAETIALDKTEISLEATETATLVAIVLPETATNKSVTWASSNEAVATVDDNGEVTAIALGEAIITATTTDGSDLSASCKVTVVPTLAETIALDKTEISLEATETATLIVTVLPELTTDKSVEWSSSNEAVAVVDENGVVTAVAVGEATITATTVDDSNLSASCKVSVVPTLAVSIELDQTEASVEEKSDLQLIATILPEHTTNKEVAWSSSDKWVASVDNYGLVTMYSAGEVIITATTTDGTNLSATCSINVYSGIDGVNGNDVIVATIGDNIVVKNAKLGSVVNVYSSNGALIKSMTATDGSVVIEAPVKGIYIVAIDGKSFKVMVK